MCSSLPPAYTQKHHHEMGMYVHVVVGACARTPLNIMKKLPGDEHRRGDLGHARALARLWLALSSGSAVLASGAFKENEIFVSLVPLRSAFPRLLPTSPAYVFYHHPRGTPTGGVSGVAPRVVALHLLSDVSSSRCSQTSPAARSRPPI